MKFVREITTMEDLNPNDVCENPNLSYEEKETSIWFAKDGERATVHSDEAGIVRRMLSHPEAEPDSMAIETGDDGEIYSFYGTIPVSCLKVLSVPRENRWHSEVVSSHTPSDD